MHQIRQRISHYHWFNLYFRLAGNMGGDQPSIIEPGNAKNVLTGKDFIEYLLTELLLKIHFLFKSGCLSQ